MNTHTLETHSDSNTTSNTASTAAASGSSRVAHPPSPLDRVALHLGMALIIWSRRSYRPGPTRDELVLRHTNLLARERREDLQLRRQLLTVVER